MEIVFQTTEVSKKQLCPHIGHRLRVELFSIFNGLNLAYNRTRAEVGRDLLLIATNKNGRRPATDAGTEGGMRETVKTWLVSMG